MYGELATGRNGEGVFVKKGVFTHVGEFSGNKFHDDEDEGTRTFLNGDVLKGQWSFGLKDGPFTLTSPNGQVLVQTWARGQLLREGKLEGDTLTFSDGYAYCGGLRGLKKWGKGKETMPSGDTYVGDFENDMRGKFDPFNLSVHG